MSQSERLFTASKYLTMVAGFGLAVVLAIGIVAWVRSSAIRDQVRKITISREKKVLFAFMAGWMLLTIVQAFVYAVQLLSHK